MNRKGTSHRLVLAVALALASGIASAKPIDRHAIIGGDADAIIGGDADAIIGGDKPRKRNAIIGGDQAKPKNAIIGGDANAIIGGDADAIIGGDADAIIGGDKPRKRNAIIGGDQAKPKNAIIGGDLRNLALLGPVTGVDLKTGTVSILGQSLKVAISSDRLVSWSQEIAAGRNPYVAVFGELKSNGSVSPKNLFKLEDSYVAGATSVLVRGKVGSYDTSTGVLTVGNQKIDMTNLLSSGAGRITVGSPIAVVGTQPVLGGAIIATGAE